MNEIKSKNTKNMNFQTWDQFYYWIKTIKKTPKNNEYKLLNQSKLKKTETFKHGINFINELNYNKYLN